MACSFNDIGDIFKLNFLLPHPATLNEEFQQVDQLEIADFEKLCCEKVLDVFISIVARKMFVPNCKGQRRVSDQTCIFQEVSF